MKLQIIASLLFGIVVVVIPGAYSGLVHQPGLNQYPAEPLWWNVPPPPTVIPPQQFALIPEPHPFPPFIFEDETFAPAGYDSTLPFYPAASDNGIPLWGPVPNLLVTPGGVGGGYPEKPSNNANSSPGPTSGNSFVGYSSTSPAGPGGGTPIDDDVGR